jgi:hypothetical protein
MALSGEVGAYGKAASRQRPNSAQLHGPMILNLNEGGVAQKPTEDDTG